MSTRSREHRERVAIQNAEYEFLKQYRLGLEMSKGLPPPHIPEELESSLARKLNTNRVARSAIKTATMIALGISAGSL